MYLILLYSYPKLNTRKFLIFSFKIIIVSY